MQGVKPSRLMAVVLVAMVGSVLTAGGAVAQAVVDCDGGGSLQSTIDAAPPGSTIEFTGTCVENLVIDRDLTIQGVGNATIDGSGAAASTVTVLDVTVTLNDLTITGGDGEFGGGIDSSGDLTVRDSLLEGNVATNGGAIDALGLLTVSDSIIRNNTADLGGGIYNRTDGVLLRVEISGNSAAVLGGGINNIGLLDVYESTVTGNDSFWGGGLVNDTNGEMTVLDGVVSNNDSTGGLGGGFVNWSGAVLNVFDSTIVDNTATGGSGGGIYNGDNGNVGGGDILVFDSLISANGAAGGAGVYNEGGSLRMFGATIEDHVSSAGAGINNTFGGSALIFDTTIVNNTAGTGGGAVFSDSGSFELVDTTMSGNVALGLAPGGAILNMGDSDLFVLQSTISANTADSGGGIYNESSIPLGVAASTVVGNTATGGATGGGINNAGTEVGLLGTILYGNTSPTGPDCAGLVTTEGFNLVGDASGCTFTPLATDLVGVDPLLGPLADNGGPTRTHALLAGSPAIDRIPEVDCVQGADQRGIVRPRGAGCDVGAFEVDRVPDVVLLVEPNGQWHIRQEGSADRTFWYGDPADIPLFGDWNGDGVDTPGMWRQGGGGGFAYLTDTLPADGAVGVAEFDFFFGDPGDQVFSGDWDGDGVDTLGINRGGHIFLSDSNGSFGAPVPTDYDFWFGDPGDRAFGGDPDGDGKDSVFLYRASDGFVYYTNETPVGPGAVATTAAVFFFGVASDAFVSGDWDGDQDDTAGIFRGSNTTVYLSNSNASGGNPAPTDDSYTWGVAGWTPVAGVWE